MKFRVSLLAVLLALCVFPASADLGGYVIRSFHTDLNIRTDSDLIVEERIEVDFSEARHGLYRTIPVRYTDPKGYGFSLGFRLESVVDEAGQPHKTKVTNQGRYVKIRIGDSNRRVRGRVVYLLRYRVRDAVSRFPDHDELYWNATGHEWQATIENASCTVHLPAAISRDSLEVAGYTGRFGSRERRVDIDLDDPQTVRFSATRDLGPLEGLTVVAAWPTGHVAFPGPLVRAWRFLVDNGFLVVPFLVFGFLWRTYRGRGRDPQGPGSVVVRYEPPEGMTPGEIGTLVDEKVDLRDITATVVDLAVRGYLKIRVEDERKFLGLWSERETKFERASDKSTADLLDHEQRILQGLFEGGDDVAVDDLENRFYKHLPEIREAIYERLADQGYFAGNPHKVRLKWIWLGVAAGLVVTGSGLAWAVMRGGLFPTAAIVPAVAGVASAVLFFVFARAMPRRTRKGVALRSWALGFEEFVDRVESERLESDRRRNVFESLLPYAMALGVASNWARQFEGIYEQLRPTWYVGAYASDQRFSASALERGLSSSMDSVAKGMTASPRSSGSGGGGFSGGGGGGGGGGSW